MMFPVSPKCFIIAPTQVFKQVFLSVALVSGIVLTGCASKPQVQNSARYAKAPDFYTVRNGDTLSGIAARYGLDYVSVAEMNDIATPYRIYVGQSIRLKNGNNTRRSSTQAVAQAAPIQRQSVTLPSSTPVTKPNTGATQTTAPVVSKPQPTIASSSVAGSSLRWVKPSKGSVIGSFNLASNVKGIRYGGNVGDAVYAAANGQIVYAADGLKEYGNLILVKHIDGYITAYAHNSKMNVKSGENVTAGQKIAEMGSTGTTRTMLEFQVRLDGKPINPTTVLPIN